MFIGTFVFGAFFKGFCAHALLIPQNAFEKALLSPYFFIKKSAA